MAEGNGGSAGTGRKTLIVADASTLIALHKIGLIYLLDLLYDEVLIPPAVFVEARSLSTLPSWLHVKPLEEDIPERIKRRRMGSGETEAICLALECDAILVTDDLKARRAAEVEGLPIIGTVGILTAAKSARLSETLKTHLNSYLRTGSRLSQQLYEETLLAVGEQPDLPSESR